MSHDHPAVPYSNFKFLRTEMRGKTLASLLNLPRVTTFRKAIPPHYRTTIHGPRIDWKADAVVIDAAGLAHLHPQVRAD